MLTRGHRRVARALLVPLLTVTSLALPALGPASAQQRRAVVAVTTPVAYVPARGTWERRTPEQAGLDPVKLAEAIAFAEQKESASPRDLAVAHYLQWGREPHDRLVGPMRPRGPATGLIVRGGYLVAEWGEPARVDVTFSVTKSFLSSVVGVAVDRGLIPDIHQPVWRLVPIEEFSSPHNRTVTWDHLLRQTSDWEGTLWGKPDWADRPQGDPSTWMTRPRNAPGTVYKYNDVRVNALALAALHVWRRPLAEVAREHLMDPIGASTAWRWHGYEDSWVEIDGQRMQSVSGGAHWGGGLFIDAYDMARFGLLTLRDGTWGDRQVLSAAWLAQARTPTAAQPTYGFMNFFLNTGGKLSPSAPVESWQHIGNGTNMIYCDPVNDLVVVARWIDRGAIDEFLRTVLAAVSRR